MTSDVQTTYDQVPYPSHAFPQTHPDRLAAVATLFGLAAKPVQDCRVLEIGAASGGNLIPMADSLPASRFVGFDLSRRQVEDGQAIIDRLGLKNIELMQANIMDVTPELGRFDYILCHGIFSWVPPEVQERILELCAELLTSEGVAFISYNTYPGWRMRGMIRDMMSYHARRFEEPKQRVQQARALLDFLAQNTPDNHAYGMLLRSELETLRSKADSYLFHEHLEEYNEPLYFHQFVERARAKRLQYVSDAHLPTVWAGNLSQEVQRNLNAIAEDLVQKEQYMDFLRNRSFRQSLVCRADVTIDRSVTVERLESLCIASMLDCEGGEPDVHAKGATTFGSSQPGSRTITTSDPLVRAALVHLRRQWPAAVPFPEMFQAACQLTNLSSQADSTQIAAQRERLGQTMLECHVSGCLELQSAPSPFVRHAAERPEVSSLVRLQAATARRVTNRRHEPAELNEFNRHVVQLLDGSRERWEVIDQMRKLVDDGTLTIQRDGRSVTDPNEIAQLLAASVERALDDLGRAALLVA